MTWAIHVSCLGSLFSPPIWGSSGDDTGMLQRLCLLCLAHPCLANFTHFSDFQATSSERPSPEAKWCPCPNSFISCSRHYHLDLYNYLFYCFIVCLPCYINSCLRGRTMSVSCTQRLVLKKYLLDEWMNESAPLFPYFPPTCTHPSHSSPRGVVRW